MKRQSLIGFLVPALAMSASAQTLASLSISHAIPFAGIPRILPSPLYTLHLPLAPAILPPAFILPGLSFAVPRLPAVRMTAEKKLPASTRRLLSLPRNLASELRKEEEPGSAPVLDDLFDGRRESNPRPEQRFELPEAELERELGLGAD